MFLRKYSFFSRNHLRSKNGVIFTASSNPLMPLPQVLQSPSSPQRQMFKKFSLNNFNSPSQPHWRTPTPSGTGTGTGTAATSLQSLTSSTPIWSIKPGLIRENFRLRAFDPASDCTWVQGGDDGWQADRNISRLKSNDSTPCRFCSPTLRSRGS